MFFEACSKTAALLSNVSLVAGIAGQLVYTIPAVDVSVLVVSE
jgi:hypothetical protein